MLESFLVHYLGPNIAGALIWGGSLVICFGALFAFVTWLTRY